MTKHLPAVNVGVDVGKSQLDLYLFERGRAITVPNDDPDISTLIRSLRRYRIERIVVEATGRLEQPFVRAALAARLPVIVVSPLKIPLIACIRKIVITLNAMLRDNVPWRSATT